MGGWRRLNQRNMKYAVSRFNTSIFLSHLNALPGGGLPGLVRGLDGWMLRGAAAAPEMLSPMIFMTFEKTTLTGEHHHHRCWSSWARAPLQLCVWVEVGLGWVDGRIDHQPRVKYVVIILLLSLLVGVWVWADGFRQLPGKYDRLINPWAGRELLSCKEEGGLCTVFRCQLTMLEVVCEFVLLTGGLLVKMRSWCVQFCYNVE